MAISFTEFIHPSDKKALEALKAVPGFEAITKRFMSIVGEKMFKIENTSSFIKLGPQQMPHIYNMLIEVCDKLDLDVPELYLSLNRQPNAYTSGDTDIFIVLTSGLVECMTAEQIKTVIAHECGHILCRHVLYHTMGRFIIDFSEFFINGIISRTVVTSIQYAFAYWMRCSEFSADRVAAYFRNSSEPVVDLMMALSGGTHNLNYSFNREVFLEQAKDYKMLIDNSTYNKALEFIQFGLNNHPLHAYRAYEIHKFYNDFREQMINEFENGQDIVLPRCYTVRIKYEYARAKFDIKKIGKMFDFANLKVYINNQCYDVQKNTSKDLNMNLDTYTVRFDNGKQSSVHTFELNKNIEIIVLWDNESETMSVEIKK